MKFSLIKCILVAALVLLVGCSENNSNVTNSDIGLEEKTPVSDNQPVNKVYTSNQGFSFEYPEFYDKSTDGYVAATSSGKHIGFYVEKTTLEELKSWIQSPP